MAYLRLFVMMFLVMGLRAQEDYRNEDKHSFVEEAVALVEECGNKDFSLCFKEQALSYLDNLPNTLEIGGVRIKPTERNARNLDEPVDLPEEPKAREQAIDDALVDKILNYFSSHTFEFKLPNNAISEFKRSFEEEGRKKSGGGGGGGKKKGGMNMMMLIQLKAMALGALALKAVGLLAIKALIIAKAALVIAGIIALKKLLEHKHHSASYEVVAHPHYDDHGHFDRSFSQELAYKAYDPNKKHY